MSKNDHVATRGEIVEMLKCVKKLTETDLELSVSVTEEGQLQGQDLRGIGGAMFELPKRGAPMLVMDLAEYRDDLPDLSEARTLEDVLDAFDLLDEEEGDDD